MKSIQAAYLDWCRGVLAVVVCAGLAACATGSSQDQLAVQSLPVDLQSDAAPDEVAARLDAGLAELGMVKQASVPDRLVFEAAGALAERFAACKRVTITDPFRNDNGSRLRFISERAVESIYTITVAAADNGSVVSYEARHAGVYLNSFTGYDFTRPCADNGELRRVLADLVDQTP